jgi:hypothetical protein
LTIVGIPRKAVKLSREDLGEVVRVVLAWVAVIFVCLFWWVLSWWVIERK